MMWLKKLFWSLTNKGVPECRQRSGLLKRPLPCLQIERCAQASTRKNHALNEKMYGQGYPYGVKVLVENRWCFVEFHAEEPCHEAICRQYGTRDIKVHPIGRHAPAAPDCATPDY